VQTVSLGRRLGAYLIDAFVAVFSAVAIAGVHYPPERISEDPRDTLVISAFFIVEVALTTGLLGYSIGKRVLGMRVENRDGEPIGVLRALVRTALMFLVIPAVVMTDDKRGLHDLAAGSRVIRA